MGEYAVVEVRHYRGGQTLRDDAMGRIGEKVALLESEFLIWDKLIYRFPSYEVACYPVPQEEGEVVVPWERRSNFYGFGIDRAVIDVLYVTPLNEEGPRYQFEVVDNELWYFSDGWFYRMERVADP